MNDEALKFFSKMARDRNMGPNSVKLSHNSDFTAMDTAFILKYATAASRILDLASGTGLIVNKLCPHVQKLVAVEKFEQFSKFIVNAPNVEIVNSDIALYQPEKKFDIITLFAVMHYFDSNESLKIYQKYYSHLEDHGVMLIKNQFGVENDVVINSYSQELKTDYYAMYRTLSHEVELLKLAGFSQCECVDIYPAECNRWKNTHFYAIVAHKKQVY